MCFLWSSFPFCFATNYLLDSYLCVGMASLGKCDSFPLHSPGKKLSSVLPLLHPECRSLPEPNLLPGQFSHGAVGIRGGKVRWLSMAFESVSCFSLHFLCSSNAFAVLC